MKTGGCAMILYARLDSSSVAMEIDFGFACLLLSKSSSPFGLLCRSREEVRWDLDELSLRHDAVTVGDRPVGGPLPIGVNNLSRA